MVRKSLVAALICIFIGSLAGCATDGTYDPGRSAGAGALGGAATGAAVGSIVGAATGHAGTGAWVGAAAGGVAGAVGGYLYAEHRNSQARSSQAAAQTYNYTPAPGQRGLHRPGGCQPLDGEAGSAGATGDDLHHSDPR